MKARTLRNLILGFLGLLLLLGVNAAVSRESIRYLVESQAKVKHTYVVLSEIELAVSMAKDVETGMRGYIITANPSFLTPYNEAERRVQDKLEPLNTLTRDNPIQNSRVEELARLIAARIAVAKENVDLVRAGRKAEAEQQVAQGRGKEAMDRVRAKGNEMRDEEMRLLKVRDEEYLDAAGRARTTFWVALLANLLLLTLVYTGLARAKAQGESLETAHSELKRLESMRDSLTAMLVHDLRTPLTTILGPLEMLGSQQFGELDEVQTEIVAMSTASAQRLLGLVNELLDISKMEAGELRVRHDTLHPSVVIEEAIKSLSLVAFEGATRIDREVPENLPVVQADQELLARVLINLLGNALKFTPSKGKITLSARACLLSEVLPERLQESLASDARHRPHGEEPQSMLFSVRDTGEGIPPEDIDRIFEKFGQVESRQAGRKMSTGLGLTFCRLAVEAHGGRIWVESTLGQGSTFRFTVPLRPRQDEASGEARTEAAAAIS